ncbi:MAG: DUF4432 family protein [Spirochaetales bacterium]|nr:DUF4432 family protein [Spirochaetales bacterium]
MESHWIISDSASSYSTSDFFISGKSLGLCENAYCRKRTLSGGRQTGVEIIDLSNGVISLSVCVTRGMSIIDGACGPHYLGWISPVKEIVHPQYINPYDLGGRGSHYGFNEMLNRCGVEWSGAMGEDRVIDNKGQYNSVFLPLHGKIGLTPASRVVLSVSDEDLILEGDVPEQNVFGVNYMLRTSIRLRPGAAAIEIEDTLSNLGSSEGEYEMLYHTNFGPPFLEKGSRYYGSFSRMVPRDEFGSTDMNEATLFGAPSPGFIEQVYLFRPLADENGLAHQILTNEAHDLAVHVAFDPLTLPYTILWKRTASEEEGYVVGLNPCSDLPNNRAFEREQGRVSGIAPFCDVKFRHTISIVEGQGNVIDLVDRIRKISDQCMVGDAGDFGFLTT